MNPNPKPDNDLPGVDDYLVHIPLRRENRDDAPNESELRVRIPAGDGHSAAAFGEELAEHLATAIRTPDGAKPWYVAVDQVSAERIATTSADEALAEMEHWKRIVTALARKMPGIVQVTAGEYEAADTSDLTALPVGPDTMMFMTPAFYAEMSAALAEQQQPVVVGDLPEHEEPLLLPAADGVVLPAQPGGIDPDVRSARVGRLSEFYGGTVEIFVKGWWLPVENVENGDDVVSVTVDLRNTTAARTSEPAYQALAFTDPQQLVTVRPATTLAVARTLATCTTTGTTGRQLLHDGSWWTISRTDWDTRNRIHTAHLVNADRGETTAAVDEDAKILLRRRRPEQWSR